MSDEIWLLRKRESFIIPFDNETAAKRSRTALIRHNFERPHTVTVEGPLRVRSESMDWRKREANDG